MTNNEKAITIGKANFKDFAEYINWCLTGEAEEFFSVKNLWTDCLYNLQGKIQGVNVSHLFGDYKQIEKKYIVPLKQCIEYMEMFSSEDAPLKFNLIYEHEDKFDIIAFGTYQFLVPKWAIEKELLKDYSYIVLAELRAKGLNGSKETGLIPSDSHLASMSQVDVQRQIDKAQSMQSEYDAYKNDVENARFGELAKLQAQIDKIKSDLEAKKQSLLAELQKKQDELNAKVKQLKTELFMLESEIYSIRCFMGEVVDFVKLRSGNDAPEDAPITLFQKIRFLDEELGKLVSVYDFDFGDVKLFEKLLQKRDDILDVFCPNDKCVSLVRVSKTNTVYGYDAITEMLQKYEVYHGRTIGILIRNGENLYIGWTDEEKINISDDNMFFTPETKTVNEEDEGKTKNTSAKEMVSRYFIFSILQGALQNKKMFTLPDTVKADFTRPSEHIIYSVADTWLCDNRYGTFDEMVKKCNSVIKMGDYVLTLDYEYDKEGYRSHSYYRNLTGGLAMYARGIYQIRLVEKNDEDPKYRTNDYNYYISLVKNDSDWVYRNGTYCDRKRDSHALFKVYNDEFINLTYMNSTWLKYVITTQNLGGRSRFSHFANTVRYLNDALKFVKEREAKESEYLKPYVEITDDMWVALSEWKLEKGVRVINDYQAKRFAKNFKG